MVTAAELPVTAVGLAGAVVGATVAGGDVGAVVAVGGTLVLTELLEPPQPARNNAKTTTPRIPEARNRRMVYDFIDIE
jgi:hypothetical protein